MRLLGEGPLLIRTFEFLFPWELIGLPNEVVAKRTPIGKSNNRRGNQTEC